MTPRPPRSTLFPYTTLFRSNETAKLQSIRAHAEANGVLDLQTLSGNAARDRKSTRLNSSHVSISYAVFCLKKKIHTSRLKSELLASMIHEIHTSSNAVIGLN